MDEQICENCGFERELHRGLCEGCEAERIATAPLLATIATLESRLAEAERERDEARAQRDGWHQNACEQAARATAAEARVKVLAASATDETEARHALRARLAEMERERDANLRRAIDSELRCTRAMDKYRTERERAFKAEKGLADAHDMLARAHRIEEAAMVAADLLGVVASEVEGDAASVYGQVRWARDARRVEASIRAALEGGG